MVSLFVVLFHCKLENWLQLIFLGFSQMSEASRRSRVTITLGRSGQVR